MVNGFIFRERITSPALHGVELVNFGLIKNRQKAVRGVLGLKT